MQFQSPFFSFVEGDWRYSLEPQGFSDDVDAVLTGVMRGHNVTTGQTRELGIAWDETREIVSIGGDFQITQREYAALERYGFTGASNYYSEAPRVNAFAEPVNGWGWKGSLPRPRDAETGLVYRGAADLIHIADGQRAEYGAELAHHLTARMRRADRDRRLLAGERDADAERLSEALPLCPGCYMVALFNAATTLARESGQSMTEMARTMAAAFDALARDPSADSMESIAVMLDDGADAAAFRSLEVA